MQPARSRVAITAIAVLIAAVFEWVIRGLPARGRKLLSCSCPVTGMALDLFSKRRAAAGGVTRLARPVKGAGPLREEPGGNYGSDS